MEISMLPIHALSIRTCATMFPPSSATAMFRGLPISLAFFSAALITRRASSNFTAVMGSVTPDFRCGLFDQVCDFFRVRKHRHVAGGNGDRSSLHRRRFGLLKLRRNSTVVARNHAPRWLRLPRGGRDCGPKNAYCCGSPRRRQYFLLLVCHILGEILCASRWGHRQKTFSIRPDFAS